MNFNTKKKDNQLERELHFIKKLEDKNPKIKLIGKYSTARIKTEFKCLDCGFEWLAVPYSLLYDCGCRECSKKRLSKNYSKGKENFIEEMKIKNPDIKVLGDYKNSKTKIKCLCKHGEFEALPYHLLNGSGCKKCGIEKASRSKTKSHDSFLKQLEFLNNDIEVKGVYKSDSEHVECQCKKCKNEWLVTPSNLLRGKGCPKCKQSKGEKRISDFLEKNNVSYKTQYKLQGCKNKKHLPFDFAVFENNKLSFLIEYDGEQHYQSIKAFGGDKKLEETRKNDSIKNEFVKNKSLKLIRIAYWDFNRIEEILKNNLFAKSAK